MIYGTSDNARRAVSNAHASHIGFRPEDSADGFAAAILAGTDAPRPDGDRAPGGRRRLRRDRPPRRLNGLSSRPSLATWPAAETRRLGPWTLRRGDGGGNRVSAATLDGPPADPAAAEAVMRGWGQPPLFMIRPGEDALDACLAARGYLERDPTLIAAAPAAALAARRGRA